MIPEAHRGTARWINIALTSVGLLVFGAFWLTLLLRPDILMDKAQDYAVAKAEEALDRTFVDIEERYGETALGRRALDFARERASNAEGRLGALRDTLSTPEMEDMKRRATEAILVIAGRLEENDITVRVDDEPPTREGIAAFLDGVQVGVGQTLDTARDLVVERFDSVMGELKLDLLIFSGTTAAAFLFALLLSLFKGAAAMRYILPVSISLSVATLFAAYWYAFGQNWAMTVLTSSYWGWSYLTLLSVLFAIMLDIALNRARISRTIMESLASAIPG